MLTRKCSPPFLKDDHSFPNFQQILSHKTSGTVSLTFSCKHLQLNFQHDRWLSFTYSNNSRVEIICLEPASSLCQAAKTKQSKYLLPTKLTHIITLCKESNHHNLQLTVLNLSLPVYAGLQPIHKEDTGAKSGISHSAGLITRNVCHRKI